MSHKTVGTHQPDSTPLNLRITPLTPMQKNDLILPIRRDSPFVELLMLATVAPTAAERQKAKDAVYAIGIQLLLTPEEIALATAHAWARLEALEG